MKLLPLLTLWACCTASAQGVSDVLKSITSARREIIAVLPQVASEGMAVALKQAAGRGTKVFLITERASIKRGGYLLTVSHGPNSIYTYLYPSRLPEAWVMVDGAWYVTGPSLDSAQSSAVQINRNPQQLKQLNAWATSVIRKGAVSRVDIVRLRFTK